MLKIGAPVTLRRTFEVEGEAYEVEFVVHPPTRTTLQASEAARKQGDEAFGAFWNPARVAEHIGGWTGPADAQGNALAPSAEALEQVRELCSPLYAAAVTAIFESLPRKREAERKNSPPSSAGCSAGGGAGA